MLRDAPHYSVRAPHSDRDDEHGESAERVDVHGAVLMDDTGRLGVERGSAVAGPGSRDGNSALYRLSNFHGGRFLQ